MLGFCFLVVVVFLINNFRRKIISERFIQQDVNGDRYIFGNKHSFVTAHMVPGAGAGDGISGGFHFPIYTFRFSLNQKWLARADLVIREKSSK